MTRLAALVVALATLCAGRAFGQVDPHGPWRTLHTEHFRIHFRPSYADVAGRAAREAERAYGLLAGELHSPRGVVDLTLADDFDGANGFATTFPSNRITVFLAPPATDPELQVFDSWLRLVIVHELAHIFHLDRVRGLWSGLQAVFGRAPGLFPNEYQPTWVVEGLATYYESKFTNAGRITGDLHTEVLAAQAAGGAARSPWDANIFTRWPAGLAPYAYGSRFLDAISHQYGDTVVPRLVEATAGQLIPYRIGRPLRRVAGVPLGTAWAPATRPAFEVPPAASERVAGPLRSLPVPRVSPDGQRVAYLSDDGRGARRLRIAATDGWRVERSHRVNGGVSYDWLGDTLVVAQFEFTGRRRIRSDLYRWLPDGSWRRVTHGARLTEPRGPTRIAIDFADNHAVIDGTPLPDPAGTTWGDVVPSPDGHWVAATRHQDGHWALVRWPAGRSDSVATIFDWGGVITDPVWAGDELWFVASPTGLPQVYRWRDSVTWDAVTREPLGARAPAPLADGGLLFATPAVQGWDLKRSARGEARTSVAAPARQSFDSAPPVATRETGYVAWPSLRPHFWIPLFYDAGLAGRFVGASTAGTDALGRTTYLSEALLAWDPLRVLGSLLVFSDAAGNPSFDFSASNDWSPIGIDSTGHEVSEEERDLALGATFVSRRWRRTLSLRLAAEYEGDRFVSDPDTALGAICTGCTRRDFVGASLSVGVAHNVLAPLAVSAQDGFAWSLSLRRREEQASARWSQEVRSRLALWARLPGRIGFASPVLALRLSGGATSGPAVETFSAGGVSSGTFDLGLGLTFGRTRAFPVRGYPGGSARGRRAAAGAAELRLPLALVGRGVGHLPLGVDKLSLSLFGDAGNAWDPGDAPRLTRLASVGAELVGDLTISYDFPLRVRLGLAEPLTAIPTLGRRSLQGYVAFASDF